MNNTIVIIAIIFAVFMVISIIVSIVMSKMNKDGKLEEKMDKIISDRHISKDATYNPKTLPVHHNGGNGEDTELGKCVEIMKPKTILNILAGIVCIAIGIAFAYLEGYLRTHIEFSNNFQYYFELVAPYVFCVAVVIYAIYRISFIFRNVYFMEKGIIYKDLFLRTKKVRYDNISDIFLGRVWRGGSTSVPQTSGPRYYRAKWFNYRYVLTFILDDKTVTSENKTINFREFNYKYLYEKGSNLRANLITNGKIETEGEKE